MVTEIAEITIDPANAAAFEAAVTKAAPVFSAAVGHAMALERIIEAPGQYRLLVEWESVDHHMVTFRESEGFQTWRGLAGPYFTAPPVVHYSEPVDRYF
jgi:quinol monooxygenase YgiN